MKLKRHDIVTFNMPIDGKNKGVIDSVNGAYIMIWVSIPSSDIPILIERYDNEVENTTSNTKYNIAE